MILQWQEKLTGRNGFRSSIMMKPQSLSTTSVMGRLHRKKACPNDAFKDSQKVPGRNAVCPADSQGCDASLVYLSSPQFGAVSVIMNHPPIDKIEFVSADQSSFETCDLFDVRRLECFWFTSPSAPAGFAHRPEQPACTGARVSFQDRLPEASATVCAPHNGEHRPLLLPVIHCKCSEFPPYCEVQRSIGTFFLVCVVS
jgi:hypothetical protein